MGNATTNTMRIFTEHVDGVFSTIEDLVTEVMVTAAGENTWHKLENAVWIGGCDDDEETNNLFNEIALTAGYRALTTWAYEENREWTADVERIS